MIKMYGIRNCDTVSKAKKWLQQSGVEFEFFDFRKDGLDARQVADWTTAVGIDSLLNRRGTTWRGLDEQQKSETSEQALIELMTRFPALIKRPVLVTSDSTVVGFNADLYNSINFKEKS